jgi:hypothetical protein
MLEASFILITLLSICLFYLGTGRDKRILFFSIGLLFVTGAISYSGFLQNIDAVPPRFLILMVPVLLSFIFLYKAIDKKKVNANYLVAIHTLRLPVEFGLYTLFLNKKIPILMTFAGWNFDIIIGISALLILFFQIFFKQSMGRKFSIAWNSIGILFLSFIVAIAILSSPFPFQKLAFDQPNVGILEFPFTFLPAVIVPIVFLSHLLLLKNAKK